MGSSRRSDVTMVSDGGRPRWIRQASLIAFNVALQAANEHGDGWPLLATGCCRTLPGSHDPRAEAENYVRKLLSHGRFLAPWGADPP